MKTLLIILALAMTVVAQQSTTIATDWGVSPSNTDAQNQVAFQNIAAAVNAGTASPYIIIPTGVYNVLSTGGTALGSYGVPSVIHCESSATTTINQTGTGKLIQFGSNNLGAAYDFTPYVFENCKITGGESACDGIFNQSNTVGVNIRNNYFFNYGNVGMYQIHATTGSGGIVGLRIQNNVFFRNDHVLGNIAYAQSGGSGSYTYMEATSNIAVSAISPMNLNTFVSGVGFRSDGYMEAKGNFTSGSSPSYVCGSRESPSSTCTVSDNVIEVFGSYAVAFGTPNGGAETVRNVVARNNQVYIYSGGFVGPANSQSLLSNSDVTENHNRADSTNHATAVIQNNLAGQGSNSAWLNTGWSTAHSTGTNIAEWGPSTGLSGSSAQTIVTPYWAITLGYNGPNVASNAYYSGGWKYLANGPATIYSLDATGGGAPGVFVASSGLKDALISWRQPLSILNNGNVGVNEPSPSAQLTVGGDVYVKTVNSGLILRDTDGAGCHRLTVNSAGNISVAAITCP